MLKESVYPLPAVFDSAFAQSDRLVLEMDLDSLDMGSVTSLLMSKGMLPNGQTLKGMLPDSVYSLAKEKLAGFGYDIAMMDRFRPWFVEFTLSALEMQKSGFETEHGLDMYFYKEAGKRGIPVDGLETLEQQVKAFEAVSGDAQVDILAQSLTETEPLAAEMDDILDAWKTGDTARVSAYMTRELKDAPEARDALLTARNRRWLPIIEQALQSGGTSFIVVGAAHLAGPGGLLVLLREQGYSVEQL
jgi:uncharacterized protein YbaP (TraB family)